MRVGMKHLGAAALLAAFVCVIASAATAHTLAAPTVTNFAPKSGGIGTKVTIVGSNLTGASVTFGGAPATAVTVNTWGNALVATVPNDPDAIAVGTVIQISVANAEGTAMPAAGFTVTAVPKLPRGAGAISKPRVAEFMPMAGRPGVTVTIRGSGFGGALAVRFGGVKATFRIPSHARIVATVPRNAKTGKISVQTKLGIGSSAGRFTVMPSA
jgi:IPT/TIG domain